MGCVGFREAIYFLLVLFGVFYWPAFLLVDTSADWAAFRHKASINTHPLYVATFVLGPEKWLVNVLFFTNTDFDGINEGCAITITALLGLLDGVAVAAIVAAVNSGLAPCSLMVGYTMTAIAAAGTLLGMPVLFCIERWCILVARRKQKLADNVSKF